MNVLKVMTVASQLSQIASQDRKGLTGDVLLYWAVRRLTKQLQDRNPGIAAMAGYFSEIED